MTPIELNFIMLNLSKRLYIFTLRIILAPLIQIPFQKFLKRFIEFCYFVDVLTYVTLSLKSIYQIYAYICSICRQKCQYSCFPIKMIQMTIFTHVFYWELYSSTLKYVANILCL